MIAPPGLIFAADAALVGLTAWLGLCAAGLGRRGLIEASQGWLLLALAWIAGSGILLGLGGGLGRSGFLGLHAAGLAVLLLGRRKQWRGDIGQGRDWLAAWGRLVRGGTPEGWLVGGLIVVLLGLTVLAAQAEPIVYDALTYRLSRIGAWLQDGTIRHYATDDPRLNYMPVAPDVVIAWLLGATNEGFHLAPLAQLAGGLLLLGATFGLGRTAGLSRLNALGAVALALGMANVAVQFTTIQSDLFTAGVFAASYLLWHRALERGEGSWVAGVGAALAFGSKGTMFYLAPGAALWVGWLAWRQRAHWQALGPTALGLLVAALVFVLPGCWRNVVTYGSLFGPRDAVRLHHGEFTTPAHAAEKLVWNLGTSAVQLLEPTAQPLWLQGVSRRAGEKLTARFSAEADPYVFIGQSRRDQLERVMRLTEPDADVVTCGILGALLFVAGLLLAATMRQRPAAAQMLVWGGGVIIYLLVQHGLVQWHHWAFRFMVLAAPWMAVVGAWGVGGLPRGWRVGAWAMLLMSATEVFAFTQWRTSQAAWQALTQPGRSASYFVYSHWRAWAEQLDQPGEPLRLAFPIDKPLASFYRLGPPRPVKLEQLSGMKTATAEAAVGAGAGWLVVPLEQFKGREGRVMGRTRLPDLAAYRALRPGEQPQPLLYRHRLITEGERIRRELLVRTWSNVPVRVELFNPMASACPFELSTPTGRVTDVVSAGSRLVVVAPVPADMLAVVTIDFPKPASGAADQGIPLVRLVP
ncbi:glycosyltransferase family 39 protein [Opitutus sp. GAS368]|uniref:ArnT family glycosyltransferase n=1 Tax=Opitutus sp. GAS368 TaxID=1882749 RepID=UPI00087B0A14|nr:glycosyltransferase family 39 protein [Opitutus sp. GAS368]SDS09133.1 Dolichyl-phosphate-mannose-protein mannosyltransferase [Opitutus sp. GAS368]